ncbi:hypothetical protein LM597_05120 [Candidatus Acetothermia bacterium]|nr:hypothetical protein [Candidatus Acetothermia bacterium]
MEFHKAKQVVIVTEASILDDVITTVTKLGAVGYTIQNATGKAQKCGVQGLEIIQAVCLITSE